MKCDKCGERASYCLKTSRTCYCKEHFKEYVENLVKRTIKHYNMIGGRDTVLAAVSGGKDSAVLLNILKNISKELGYKLQAVHINLGVKKYSDEAERLVRELAYRLEVNLTILNLKELVGVDLPVLSRRSGRPACSVCGLIKRYLLNAIGVELGAIVATGHTLEDFATYMLKNIMTGDYEAFWRLSPIKPEAMGAAKRIQPLALVYEDYIQAYAEAENLPFLKHDCPLKEKGTLENIVRELIIKLEKRKPGITHYMVRSFIEKKKEIKKTFEENTTIHTCVHCGLMSTGEECGFCRLTRKVIGEPMGGRVRTVLKEKIRSP